MTYEYLAYVHLAIIIPAFLIGTFLLVRGKGTAPHKMLGRIYLVLIAATGLVTLWMPAHIGPKVLGHFGLFHFFSLLALWTAPSAYAAARRGDIKTHREKMIGFYIGGLLIAGAFAFTPGRMLHGWLFGPALQTSARPAVAP
jgi:uncharacterized membrane protein